MLSEPRPVNDNVTKYRAFWACDDQKSSFLAQKAEQNKQDFSNHSY